MKKYISVFSIIIHAGVYLIHLKLRKGAWIAEITWENEMFTDLLYSKPRSWKDRKTWKLPSAFMLFPAVIFYFRRSFSWFPTIICSASVTANNFISLGNMTLNHRVSMCGLIIIWYAASLRNKFVYSRTAKTNNLWDIYFLWYCTRKFCIISVQWVCQYMLCSYQYILVFSYILFL